MNRRRRPLAALALIALAALISACGSGAPAETDAGGGGNNNSAANAQKAVRFAECMRSNGVSEFPDPDASGELTIDGIANRSSVDPSSAAFKQAISAHVGHRAA